ncbi:MAG: hypothetical protein AAGA68_08420 [Pseudomonadota bacterium]
MAHPFPSRQSTASTVTRSAAAAPRAPAPRACPRRTLSIACAAAMATGVPQAALAQLPASAHGTQAGFVLNGVNAGDSAGRSSAVGDVNGDGIGDLLIRASGAAPNGMRSAGEAYVVFGRSGGFPSEFELSTLAVGDGSEGFVINGIDMVDVLGNELAGTGRVPGDVNGDGIDDIVLGAAGADPGGRRSAGEAYVIFGRISGFPSEFELSTLATGDGSEGFVLNGIDVEDQTGVSLGGAGDVNGDGIQDIFIGADRADPNGVYNTGEAYVVFGRNTGFPAQFELADLATGDGSSGFVLNGAGERDSFGYSIAGLGDINGDGLGDLCIGSLASPDLTYVVFGRASGFPAQLNLGDLPGGDGTEGFAVRAADAFDGTGEAVNEAGDVNGDGIDDILIGADSADPGGRNGAGRGYVIFGRTTGFPPVFDLGVLLAGDGTEGFAMNGVEAADDSARRVGGAGDVNGDGIADVIISGDNADVDGKINAGESYVVFGRQSGFPAQFELSSLAAGDGSQGFVIVGIDEDDRAGSAVSRAGDVNADGIDDVLVGSFNASPDGKLFAGETYVVYGTRDGFPPVFELATLTPPIATTTFAGADARVIGCRNVTTGEAEVFADPPPNVSTLIDCGANGVGVVTGDEITITVRGVSLTTVLTGGTDGLTLQNVLCTNETTGDRRLALIDANGRWDCDNNGFPLGNEASVSVNIAATVQ